MRRLWLAIALAVLAAASPAAAADHFMHIQEVVLSGGGSTSQQFVELRDHADEPFGSGPYRLVLYDAAANRVGHQEVPATLMGPGVDETQPILLASAGWNAARDPDGEGALTLSLPGAGQLCFTGNGDAERRIHCVGWGCVTTYLPESEKAPAPPDGQSIQLAHTTTHVWTVAAPSPDAANVSGETAEICPAAGGGGSGGGGGGGGGGTQTPGDNRAPVVKVVAPSRPRIRALNAGTFKVGVTADEPGVVVVAMKVDSRMARRLGTKRVIADTSAARTPASVKLRTVTKKLARRLKRLKSLRVSITATVTDAAGNAGRKTIRVTLRR